MTTERGRPPQVLLNRLPDGWLVTIGNHQSPVWAGRVRLDLRGLFAESVTEVWTQSSVEATVSGDGLSGTAVVPPFCFRVYRVRQRGS